MKRIIYLFLVFLMVSCAKQPPQHFTHDVLNRMTPIKDQGKSQTCWIYAMLAAIETEHLSWGDSVNLSPYYIEKMLEQEPQCPASRRGMGATLIRLIHKYGIVGYNAMRSVDTPAPRFVFMLGAEYTPQEFARSVCARDEYVALTSTSREPYYKETVLNVPDNWLHDRFLNLPMDSLLAITLRAVRQHHGVCWESRAHAMAIVGIAHNDQGEPYFIMKNSWGTDGPYKGLDYLSFDDFKAQTLAVELPHFVVYASNVAH
jgi:bleomycin hydrolase